MDSKEQMIQTYFKCGYSHQEIVDMLAHEDGINISIRTLRTILKNLSLTRRKCYSNLMDVSRFICEELLSTTGYNKGYRWVYSECISKGFVVRKEHVRHLLKILTPENVACRLRRRLKRRQYKNKGPNFLWHMDGYDKLKPYGLCISGCIDGFSRKIMWLNAYKTNNNPQVIAGYFCEAIANVGGCPTILRADLGTENGTVATIQHALRSMYNDRPVDHCFLYGKSTANQRIEAWWGILRRESAQCWLNILGKLLDDGNFNGGDLDKSLIQFCFMKLLQKDLDKIVKIWNCHKITKRSNTVAPNGKPNILYAIPKKFGGEDRLKKIDTPSFINALNSCIFREPNVCSNKYVYNLSNIYLREKNWHLPKNVNEAVTLYINLRMRFLNDLPTV